jgi:hypothetical protein
MGFNNAVCRFGGMLMPVIGLWFFKIGTTGPVLAFGVMSLVSAISAFKIPSDTTNISLDIYHELIDLKSPK